MFEISAIHYNRSISRYFIMKKVSLKNRVILMLIVEIGLTLIGQAKTSAEPSSSKQSLLPTVPKIVSSSITISKKDFEVAKELLDSEIKTGDEEAARNPPTILHRPNPDHSKVVTPPADIKYRQDIRNYNKLLLSKDQASDVEETLYAMAYSHMIKFDYPKAEKLYKSARIITKASGKNSSDWEKYKSDFEGRIRKNQ